jgi:hypothetical protein
MTTDLARERERDRERETERDRERQRHKEMGTKVTIAIICSLAIGSETGE